MVTTDQQAGPARRETPRALPLLVDEGFPGRTLRTSLLVSVIVCVFTFVWELGRPAESFQQRHAVSLGFALGAAVSLMVFGLLIWAVQSVIRTPEEGKPRKPGLLVAALVFQLPVIGAAFYGGLRYLGNDLSTVLALAAGLGVWFFVAVLKVASILLLGSRQVK